MPELVRNAANYYIKLGYLKQVTSTTLELSSLESMTLGRINSLTVLLGRLSEC